MKKSIIGICAMILVASAAVFANTTKNETKNVCANTSNCVCCPCTPDCQPGSPNCICPTGCKK